jgi:SAM-dependent methyltransferase
MDPFRIVRTGYDKIASQYLQARLAGDEEVPLLDQLLRVVPPGSLVLDAGCGAGLPLTKALAQSYRVVGVDFSWGQLQLAAKAVPKAWLACQDLTRLGLAPLSFTAVCSFYAIIHIPRSSHETILRDVLRLLEPQGYALLCLGAEDLPQDLGTYQGAPMYWSHFDAETYVKMLSDLGFSITHSLRVRDPIDQVGGHLFVLAQKVRA